MSNEPTSKPSHSDILRARYKRICGERRGGVSAESYTEDDLKNAPEKKVIPKDAKTRLALADTIASNVLFRHLEHDALEDLYNAMFPLVYLPGQSIIEQGADGDNFYVIEEGEVDVFVNKKKVSTLKPPAYFGELALIYNAPRAADVIAKTNLKVWALDRDSYRSILMESTIKKRAMYQKFLSKVPLLQTLDEYERFSIADALEEVTFAPRHEIIRQGDEGDYFFIILEGTVTVLIRPSENLNAPHKKVATLGEADYFGELALLFDKPRAATVIADTEVRCLTLDRCKFERLLGNCADILKRNLEQYSNYYEV